MDKQIHPFERAGLGLAPFRCVGCRENWFVMGGGERKPGGSCDYCGTGILYEYVIRSKDGAEFVVGCDCVLKTGGPAAVVGFKEERLKMSRERRAVKASERRSKREAAWEREKAARIADNGVAWLRDHAELDARLKAYAGPNEFVKSMARTIEAWGGLTDRQISAVERSLAVDAKRQEQINKCRHVGIIGKRMKAVAKVVLCRELEPRPKFNASWILERRFMTKLETEEGHLLVWFSGTGYAESEIMEAWKFTPKEFGEYDGVLQTIVSRLAEA